MPFPMPAVPPVMAATLPSSCMASCFPVPGAVRPGGDQSSTVFDLLDSLYKRERVTNTGDTSSRRPGGRMAGSDETRLAVVSGGGTGIGLAVARRLSAG